MGRVFAENSHLTSLQRVTLWCVVSLSTYFQKPSPHKDGVQVDNIAYCILKWSFMPFTVQISVTVHYHFCCFTAFKTAFQCTMYNNSGYAVVFCWEVGQYWIKPEILSLITLLTLSTLSLWRERPAYTHTISQGKKYIFVHLKHHSENRKFNQGISLFPTQLPNRSKRYMLVTIVIAPKPHSACRQHLD